MQRLVDHDNIFPRGLLKNDRSRRNGVYPINSTISGKIRPQERDAKYQEYDDDIRYPVTKRFFAIFHSSASSKAIFTAS